MTLNLESEASYIFLGKKAVFVKMKGGETAKKMNEMTYLWNVMDRKTRFLLVSKLSKRRDDDGAIRALEAKKNAQGSQPEAIITDALRSYNEGIAYTWFTTRGRSTSQELDFGNTTQPTITLNG